LYLARELVRGKPRYVIRESVCRRGRWQSRDLFELGEDPGRWIHYPGGTSYFIDERVEESLGEKGVHPTQEQLEEVFWPFLAPQVRRIIERFRQQRSASAPFPRIPRAELARMQAGLHAFDKRRLHYLRTGRADVRGVDACPLRLYNRLLRKSRDEIEQMIEGLEGGLRPRDHKEYVYAALGLQRHFPGPLAGRVPQALDPERMDEALLQEICRLQADAELFAGGAAGDTLHPSLVRYVIMYFDGEFGPHSGERAYVEDFVRRHRAHRPPAPRRPRLSPEDACRALGIPPEAWGGMNARELSRRYRVKALECHPDQGGSHERFIRITRAYKALLESLLEKRPGGTAS